MAIKITVFNPKGGVGKTTSAKSIAGELSKQGYRVLLIDCDSSADTTRGIAQSTKPECELSKLIMEYCDEAFAYDEEAVKDCICATDFQNLDMMPATTATMQEADRVMMSVDKMLEPDKAFSALFKDIENEYDFIIYDTKEGEGEWHRNVLNHVEYLLCPSQAAVDSISGYTTVLKKINLYKRSNAKLKFLGMFVTSYSDDAKGRDMVNSARSTKSEYFIPVAIRYSKLLESASMDKAPICYYKDDSNPAIDYRSLTDYIIENTGNDLSVDPARIKPFDAERLINYTMLVYPDEIMDEYKKGKKTYNKVISEYKKVAMSYFMVTNQDVSLPEKDVKDDVWLCEHDDEYKKVVEDIKENGIREPLIVTPLNTEGYHMIIDGAKRRDAAIELGLQTPIRIIWEMDMENEFAPMLIDLAKNQMTEKVEYANNATRKLKAELLAINRQNDIGSKEVNNG